VSIYSNRIWKDYIGQRCIKQKKKIQIFQEKVVYKGHNSYDDLQLKLSDTHIDLSVLEVCL
jgi:hypothetical protein